MFSILIFASVLNAADLSPVQMERTCEEPKVVVVSEGRAQLPIIVAAGRREREAAFYLASTIRDITGVKPDIYVETAGHPISMAPALRIAKSNGGDRFRVITKHGTVRFLGRSEFAVYDWCERVLGVRHYPTGKGISGKTFPRARDLAVEAVDYADQPVFTHRDNWPFGGETWARVGKVGGSHKGGVAVHAPHRWFADPDVRTNHPNIFARQPDGSRGEMPLLCYGNPETLAYYKQRIDEHIAGLRDSGGIVDTNRHVITVSHWDVLLDCTCPHCQKLLDPALGVTGNGSPVIWGYFLKNLATWARHAHPDYTVAFLPYLNVCDVPAAFDLKDADNCEAMVCSMPGLAMFKEPSVRQHEEALIYAWACVTGRKVINWHYGCWPREFTSAPYLFGKTIAAHYQRMAPFVVGSFINAGNATAAEQLTNYVWLRCLWNPNIDIDALYDTFAQRMFGPAAEPMRRLIALQEDGWARPWPWPHHSLENLFDISYPPEDIATMKRLLDEAEACAQNDAEALTRVGWYGADFVPFFRDEARYARGLDLPPLTIAAAETPPVIDGDLSDACWTNATPRAFIPAFETQEPLARTTTMRTCWTTNGVYLAFRCHEPDMTNLCLTAAYGEEVKQDTLEIFFVPGEDTTKTCYRLMFDVRNRMTATADEIWTARGVVSAIRRDANEWRLELFIPFSALTADCSRTCWRGNVTRRHPLSKNRGETSRLATLGSAWNQDRNAFCEWRFSHE